MAGKKSIYIHSTSETRTKGGLHARVFLFPADLLISDMWDFIILFSQNKAIYIK